MGNECEARTAIADLVYGYARHIREGRGAECGVFFTEDATFKVRQASSFGAASFETRTKLSGRDAITAYVSKTTSQDARVCPAIFNLIIEVRGEHATSNCVMTILRAAGGQQILGEYNDSFRNEGGWRFSSRIFTIIEGAADNKQAG